MSTVTLPSRVATRANRRSAGDAAPRTVCFPFVCDAVGGSHISAARLIDGLDRRRYTPLVVVHGEDGPLIEWLTARGIDSIAAPDVPLGSPQGARGLSLAGLPLAYAARTLPALVRFIRANDIAVVHTNDGRMHANWGPAARLAGAKLVWHHRGDPTARGVNTLAPMFADHVVTVSDFSRPVRPVLSLRDRVSVIHSPFDRPQPVEREPARQALVAELGVEPDARFLGYFGYYVDRKRPTTFVDIIARYRDLRPDEPVHGLLFGRSIAGETAVEEAVVRRIEELGAGGFVHMMGFREPVEPLMCAIEALVVPAMNEPFGRTLIEAMMLGTPVVAARHGGNIEAIDHGRTGLLVPHEDSDAFAAALATLLHDHALRLTLSETARADALERFSVQRHIDDVTAVYDRVLGIGAPTREPEIVKL